MFLRQTRRQKDGKTHHYWSVVENQRLQNGRVVQRQVLYLGEISPSQAAAWRKSIEVFDEAAGQARTLALFPEDRCAAVAPDTSVVSLPCCSWQTGACARSPFTALSRLLRGRDVHMLRLINKNQYDWILGRPCSPGFS